MNYLGIAAQAQPIAKSRAERHNIFQGATKLHAGRVRRHLHAKGRAVKKLCIYAFVCMFVI